MTAEQHDIDVVAPRGTELARYRVCSGERVLMGHRLPGGVKVSDRPSSGQGRCYDVDSGFMDFAQLAGFVADYLVQAERLDACPMSQGAIGTMLGRTEADAVFELVGEVS